MHNTLLLPIVNTNPLLLFNVKLTLARWGPGNHFNGLIIGWPSGIVYMSKYPTGYVLPKGCCIIVCYLQTTENRISSVHYWVEIGHPRGYYIIAILFKISITFYFQIFFRYVNDAFVKPSHVQLIKLSDMQMFNLTAGNTTCFVQQIWIISTSVVWGMMIFVGNIFGG